MVWQFIGGGSTGRPLAASGTTDVNFPGALFQTEATNLGLGVGSESAGVTEIVPKISLPELNLTAAEREARGGTFGQWELGMPLAFHGELYEDSTGLANKDTGQVVPFGIPISNFHPLTADEIKNHDIHIALRRMRAKYDLGAVNFGDTQTGGAQAFVAPSGGTQVLFPGQSSSGVV